ncbi:ral GTPase-activating protein subunit beta-like [Watersipora subatra]|uniref:ral GTPase-activating protein subunit beta-like n=1 Tax=Watersipora subatra TaxID=2589382 RepID=UPI00355B44FF
MYSEWVSLQTCIQSDTTHTSVLKRFPATVGKEIVVPIVRNLAQGLSINGNDQPSKLHSSEEVNWTMEVICHGLTLPFSELEIIKECVNIYCEWLTGCLLKKKLCIPKPVMESPVTYSITVLSHLYNLFVPREKASQDLVNKQALLCHRALRTLENVTKESQCLTRELWEAILKFLLATTDTLLAPPKEKDGISDELAARMVSVLFEMWLLSCSTYFPVPSLWRTFRDMCANWRHHEPVILQWNRVNYALTAPLLLKLYGPDHPEIVIGASEKALVTALTKECVEKLSPDCLLQCWFRFLHILSNPVDLCKIGVISETPMFLHHAIANAKVVEPSQHECLQQLPVIFYKAMKGIANLMDSFLGSGAKPMSPNKFSSHSLAPSQSSVTSQVSGGYLQYSARPSLSSDRSSINSILNLLGPWLFEAAMSFDNRRSRPGSQSQRTASMSSPSTDPLTNRELNFDIGRAEACGAIARLLCSKKSGEVIQPVYIARSYMALYHALSLTYPIKGDVLTFTLFHMADILRVDLPGVNGLIPKVLGAIEAVLTTDQHNFKIHEQLTEVELRKACIHLLMSLVCLPLHFHKMDIKDLYSGELMLTYLSLTSRVAKIILNALTVEKSSGNSNMLLGCLALLVQDMATHENREMEKFSSTTSNLSQDQYNFPGAGASETTSQSGDGHSELSSSSNEKSTIEVVLRRPSTKQNHDDFSSAAGLLVGAVKQICTGLITDWWTDYHLAVGALEVLTTLAKVKLQIISTAMCKDTVSHICRLISFLCCRPPQNQTRDLHSTILSALYCLSQWILEHSYLLQDKECLYTVLEVVELGISGKRSQQPNSSTVLMKGDKEHLPMSLRVKDAAEALLMCIIDHVDSFPAPCGPESLYSTLSERDLTEDPSNFKYFALNNNTLLAILEDNSKPVGGGTSAIKLVIRGPFGRQIWLIEPKSEPAGSLKPLHVPRPKSSDVPLEKPKITQRWWPSGVENIPLVKADNSLPKLDDLEDLDSVLAGVINEQIEKELKNGPSLAPGRPGPPDEAQPPKSSDYRQAARALLSQLGLLGAQSLQDFQGMPPSLSRLQTKDNEFFTALDSLDNTSNRARHSVYVFYVKAGQSKVSDILDNMTSYRSLNGDFKDILLSLGWPVNINHHPGWTGLITEESHPGHPRPHQPSVDQIPLACGPAAYDGTKWLLYWGDSRTEVAFIVPTEQRLAMIIRKKQLVKQTSTGSDCVFTASGSFRSSSDSARESGRNQKTAEVRMIVVWCERVEDKDIIPWESLLNTTNGPNDFRCPPEYMIVYITALQSGLFRVHIHSQTERCGTPLPLVDGAVCVKRTLGVMIRQTAINMAARRRLLNELSLIPHNKRAQKMQELIGKYRVNCTESEFYESLFRESYDQK